MTRQETLRRRLEALLSRYGGELSAAFYAAVRDLRETAELTLIIDRLRANDIEGAIEAAHLDAAAFRAIDAAIISAYEAGGAATVALLPRLEDAQGRKIVVRFGSGAMGANSGEQFLRRHAADLVTRITDEQRAIARDVLTEGLVEGVNPRRTALNLVGRVSRATGRREGGVIGLTEQQAGYVRSMRQRLSSGDPAEMRKVLTMSRRDQRFDAAIRRHIRDGTTPKADDIARMTGRYSDSLLKLRGDTIARTETLGALHKAQSDAWEQVVEAGGSRREDIVKEWVHRSLVNPRVDHVEMDGEQVGMDERFSNGLMYPGDPSGPVEEIANCHCQMVIRRMYPRN